MEISRQPILSSRPAIPPFGENIKRARKRCGLSQKELAFEVGWKSATAISLLEHDMRQIDARDLLQIAYTTDTPIGEFFEFPLPESTDDDYEDMQASQ